MQKETGLQMEKDQTKCENGKRSQNEVGFEIEKHQTNIALSIDGFSARNSIFYQIVVLLSLVMAFQPHLAGEVARWNDG